MNIKHQRFSRIFLELIHERGFKATTMRDVAKAMDCDVSNLYNYTSSKQAFLVKVLFKINDDFQNRIDQIISSKLSPLQQLDHLVSFYVHLSLERPLELSLLTNEWKNLKGEALLKFVSQRDNFEKKLQLIIKSGIDQKLIKSIDLQLATHLFLSSLRLLFDKYTDTSKVYNLPELESQIKSYIFSGLADNLS